MQAAHPSLPEDRTPRSQTNERTCLVTGETLPKDELIRFAVDAGNMCVPDLALKLPGRGFWVKADRASVTQAVGKSLFAKAAKSPVRAAPDLADLVTALLRKRCLDFMGLARRAGIAVLGQTQVEAAVKSGELGLLLLADDATQEIRYSNNVPQCRLFSRHELGAIFGYDQIVYAGLKADALTEKLKGELRRLQNFIPDAPLLQDNRQNNP